MSENREGYQDPYASEDIKRMREMYDNAVRKLVGGCLGTGAVDVQVKVSRLLSLPPEFMHEVHRDAVGIDDKTVLFTITIGDGDTYNVKALTDEGGKEVCGTMSKTDIIHLLNETEVASND